MKNKIPNCIKKGETRNPNGRPKKIKTIAKRAGYSESQVRDLFSIMMNYTINELLDIMKNEGKTILEKILASAMLSDMKKGNFYNIEKILLRLFGAPKQQIDMNVANISINEHLTDSEELQSLLKQK